MNWWDDPALHEMVATVRAFLDGIEASQCLVVADPEHFPQQTKLLVNCSGNISVEFTILDSQTCKVLVKDGKNFTEPTEGKLLGTKKRADETTPGNFRRGDWKLLPGRLLRMGLLAYEVGGKEYLADGIREVEIIYPTGRNFNLWAD